MATRDGTALASIPEITGGAFATTRETPGLGFLSVGDVPNNAVPPTITIISPTPGVAPGDPGGFPADYELAKHTFIVVDITDVDPGVAFIVVSAILPGVRGLTTVYKGPPVSATFRDPYDAYSFAEVVDAGRRLHVRHDDGWPPGVAGVEFKLDAIDSAGNVVSL